MPDAATAAPADSPDAEKLEKIKAADTAMRAYYNAVVKDFKNNSVAASIKQFNGSKSNSEYQAAIDALKAIDEKGWMGGAGHDPVDALKTIYNKASVAMLQGGKTNANLDDIYNKASEQAIARLDNNNARIAGQHNVTAPETSHVELLRESRAAKPAAPAAAAAPAVAAKKPAAATNNNDDEKTLTIARGGSLSGAVLENKALMKIANDTFPNLSPKMQAYLMSIIIAQENGISTPDQVKPGVYKIPDGRIITENADKVRSVQYKKGATVEDLLRKDTEANPATTTEAAPATPPEAAPPTPPEAAPATPPAVEANQTQQQQIAADTATVNDVLSQKPRKISKAQAEAIEDFISDSSDHNGKLSKREMAAAHEKIELGRKMDERNNNNDHASELHTLAEALRKAGVGGGIEAAPAADKTSITTATGPRVNQGRGGLE